MEKTYNKGEMLEMLADNPKLMFKRSNWLSGNSAVGIRDGKIQMVRIDGSEWTYRPPTNAKYDKYVELCSQLAANFGDWQIVRTPVTWQEALQALIEGRTVLCQCADCTGKVIHKDENRARECSFPTGGAICITALKTGTWYIE